MLSSVGLEPVKKEFKKRNRSLDSQIESRLQRDLLIQKAIALSVNLLSQFAVDAPSGKFRC